MRGTGWKGFAIGFLNAAFPFVLIAWGEKYVDSGVAAIANATVPIFVILLALRFNPSERVSGVAPVGDSRRPRRRRRARRPPPGGRLVGGRGHARHRRRLVLVRVGEPLRPAQLRPHRAARDRHVSCATGALILLPFAIVQWPDAVPSPEAIASIAALGIFGTAVALLFFYRLLKRYGAARASLVTYLLPPVALVYGVLILDETVTLNAALGLVLILAGVALGSGASARLLRRGRGSEREPEPSEPAAPPA